jgi:hypothetical protein
MADKQYNITVPDGTTVSVPAWATEDTLARMAQATARSTLVSRQMLKSTKKVLKADKKVLAALDNIIETTKANAATDETTGDLVSEAVIGASKAVLKTSDFFGDAEKPLSSMVGAVSTLASKLNGPDGTGGLKALMGKMKGMGNFMKKFGGGIGVLSDVALALAGWNAAKFEKFASAQKLMIDSGAIFYQTAGEFDQLYKDSMRSGIHYVEFAETIQNFGGTMTALGGDVSQGSKAFIGMFKTLSENTDVLGDLGMQNKEMMTMYASYLETQRLVGAIDAGIANQGKGLEDGFKNLVVETTALASVTSLNRGDALNRQMAALSDQFLAAGAQKLEENGMTEQANAAKALVKQLALFKDQGPGSEHLEELSRSLNKNIFEFSGNIERFDVRTGMAAETRGAINKLMPELFGKINNMVRTGEMTSVEANTMLLNEFSKIDMTKLATAGAPAGSMLAAIQAIQASGRMIMLNFGNMMGMDEETIQKLYDESRVNQGVAGTTVKAMNDASKMFLTMQDAITLPMASLSAGVKGLAEWFETNTTSLKDWKNGFLNGNTETNVLEVKDPTVKTDTIDYLDDEQLTNEKNQNITTSQDNNPNKEVSTATPETNETSGSAVTNGEILANRKLQAQMDRLTNYQNASIIANKDKDNEISQEEKDAYEAEVKLMKAIIDNMQKTMRQNEITITANKSNTKATAAN